MTSHFECCTFASCYFYFSNGSDWFLHNCHSKTKRAFQEVFWKITNEFVNAHNGAPWESPCSFPTSGCVSATYMLLCVLYKDQCYMSGHAWYIRGDLLWLQSRVLVRMLGYLLAFMELFQGNMTHLFRFKLNSWFIQNFMCCTVQERSYS